MSNAYDLMRQALQEARTTQEAADSCANALADILNGRLHHVSVYRLAALKKQLQKFDAARKVWKP